MKRAPLWFALAFSMAGCATAPAPSPMALSDLQRFRLMSVDVQSQGAVVSWPAKEAELLATANVDPDTRAGLPTRDAREFPAAQVYFESAIRQRLGADMQQNIAPLMRGSVPVAAVVQVRTLDVPSPVRRLLVDQIAKLELQIDLVNPATGAVVLSYKTPEAHQWLLGGLGAIVETAVNKYDPGAKMLDEAVTDYKEWLERR